MRPVCWLHRVLATCLLAVVLHAQAAGAGKNPASPLSRAAALAKPVTYTETKISLAELVHKVAANTGVALSASQEVADEPVAVVVKALPARELLDQIAELLDYRWRRVGQADSLPSGSKREAAGLPHYEIYQDLASQRREEALRQSWKDDLREELRAKIRDAAALAALPPPRFQEFIEAEERHRQELEDRFRNQPPEQGSSIRWSPEESARGERLFYARQLTAPISRALAVLLGSLSERQWAALWREETLVFSAGRRPGELPLPADVLRRFREIPPPASEQKGEQPWGEATGYPVTIEVDAGGLNYWNFRLDALAAPLRDGVPVRPSESLYPSDQACGIEIFSKLHEVFAGLMGHTSAERTPERQAALEKDPVVGVPRRFTPPRRPRRSRFGPRPWSLEDLLPDLARTYHVQFIADAYGRWYWYRSEPRFTQDLVSGEPRRSLLQLLDTVEGCRWDRRGNLIRLRSRTWYWERRHEVPLSLLRRWEHYGETRGALPLAEYEVMATTLNDTQLRHLYEILGRSGLGGEIQFQDSDATFSIYALRDALRLYRSLSPEERQGLWAGKPLPLANMRLAQRRLFLSWDVWRDAEHRARNRTALLPGAHLSLAVSHGVCVRERDAWATRYLWEPAEAKPLDDRPRPTTPAADGERGIQRFFVMRLEFRFRGATNEEERRVALIVAEPR